VHQPHYCGLQAHRHEGIRGQWLQFFVPPQILLCPENFVSNIYYKQNSCLPWNVFCLPGPGHERRTQSADFSKACSKSRAFNCCIREGHTNFIICNTTLVSWQSVVVHDIFNNIKILVPTLWNILKLARFLKASFWLG